jgi:hypothetical protein
MFSIAESEATTLHALSFDDHGIQVCSAVFVRSRAILIIDSQKGENIIVNDAGGGTSDLQANKLENEYPLRMEKDLYPSIGKCYSEAERLLNLQC